MSNIKEKINKCIQDVRYDVFNYSINISLINKYVYVETPKAGCSTIKDTLQRMELEYPDLVREEFEDIHRRNRSPLLSPSQVYGVERFINSKDYFVFCFVRNPYTRLLSAYLDKIVNDQPAKKSILFSMGEDPSELSKKISFHEFLDVICGQSIPTMNPHWRVQYYQTLQNCINYDFVGRLESFQEDFTYVLSNISDNYRNYYRPEVRHATNSNDLIEKYYNDGLIEKVYNKFKIDFDYFGYDEKLPL
jgi:hypothetical protein